MEGRQFGSPGRFSFLEYVCDVEADVPYRKELLYSLLGTALSYEPRGSSSLPYASYITPSRDEPFVALVIQLLACLVQGPQNVTGFASNQGDYQATPVVGWHGNYMPFSRTDWWHLVKTRSHTPISDPSSLGLGWPRGGWGGETTKTTNACYLTRPWAHGPAN